MNKNLDRRIHPIAEADGLSPKKLARKMNKKHSETKLNFLQMLQVTNFICTFAPVLEVRHQSTNDS